MRVVLFFTFCLLFVFSAFWVYREYYQTQATLKRVMALRVQIEKEEEKIKVLEAEWAYLKSPNRLRELVNLNFRHLGLVPLTALHFGEAEMIIFSEDDFVNFDRIKPAVKVQNLIDE